MIIASLAGASATLPFLESDPETLLLLQLLKIIYHLLHQGCHGGEILISSEIIAIAFTVNNRINILFLLIISSFCNFSDYINKDYE
jgi:hypothetical protein